MFDAGQCRTFAIRFCEDAKLRGREVAPKPSLHLADANTPHIFASAAPWGSLMRYARIVVVGFVLCLPVSAGAQADFAGPLSPGAFEATLNMGPIADTLRRQMQPPSPQGKAGKQASAATKPVSVADFRYTPSKSRRSANLKNFVSKTKAVDPKGADTLAKLIASQDIIEAMRPPLARYGLRIDNVADAYAVWLINSWQATRGTTDDPSPASAAAVRRQVMNAMASAAIVTTADDASKQEMAEALLLQALLVESAVEQSQSEPDQLQAVGRAAAQGARGMGIDLAGMTLTDRGMVSAQ